MKKLLALLAFAFLFSCQSNGDDEDYECENKVWNMVIAGEMYYATYGPTEASSGTVEVNEETYDYYTGLGNVNDGSLCWEGTKN
ncbi:MAG: hypothetical protein EOO50_00890 [Flavobacterium sp.]|uniref:hypothetical protein n=1 Tax=Flavobacterium sp. TaxID=239 RepID=UPI001220417E|nr:hypothetical protein [Flavobacterium sp.]RZJ68767.1 MAG: hypothetical protein EOO50_00890 [Flavobacterium sp.]